MKRATLILAALALFSAGMGRASADIVYDNGPINGTIGGPDINGLQSASDSFTVTGDTMLTGAQNVGLWVDTGYVPLEVTWSIGTTFFGSDISSGTSAVSSSFIESAGNNDVYDSSFALTGAVNAGITYYLTLADAVGSDGGVVLWDENNGMSTAEMQSGSLRGGKTPPTPVASESFQLVNGVGASVPEPSTFILASIVGLMALGYALRTTS